MFIEWMSELGNERMKGTVLSFLSFSFEYKQSLILVTKKKMNQLKI